MFVKYWFSTKSIVCILTELVMYLCFMKYRWFRIAKWLILSKQGIKCLSERQRRGGEKFHTQGALDLVLTHSSQMEFVHVLDLLPWSHLTRNVSVSLKFHQSQTVNIFSLHLKTRAVQGHLMPVDHTL